METMVKKVQTLCAVICVLSLLIGSSIVKAQDESNNDKQYVIITKDAGITEEKINDAKIKEVFESEIYKTPDIVVADLTAKDVKIIENDSNTLTVEEDVILTGNTDKKKKYNPVKTEDINQWYLKAIGVENTQIPEEKVKVALVDSGVSFSDDIEVTDNINFVDSESEQPNPLFLDESGHGTALAGVICAKDNGEGIIGVNPNVELYSAKVLDSNNQAPLSRVIKGIYWAVQNNVDIINLSIGTTVNSEALHNAVKEAYNKDILLIASAGNTEHQAVQYPAAYNEVVAVGSTNTKGELAEFSSAGTELELLAPGEKIATNGFLGFTTVTSGTSIATAQVTGVASLLLQKDTSKSSDFIRKLLKTSAKTVEYDVGKSAGLIDFDYANSIYNDFSVKYLQGLFNINEYENTLKPQDYSNDTESIAEGLWGGVNHANISEDMVKENGSSSFKNSLNLSLIKKAAKDADTILGSGLSMECKCLHGKGNYVASLKFLHKFAKYLEKGNDITNSKINALNSLPNDIRKNFIKVITYNDSNKIKTPSGVEVDRTMANYIAIYLKSKEYNDYSSKQKKYLIIGLICHLIGDVYAHRTIVKKGYVDGTYLSEYKHFDSSDFLKNNSYESNIDVLATAAKNPSKLVLNNQKLKCWQAFKKTVEYGFMEYIDVKFYMNKFDNSKYEDNIKFASYRWEETEAALRYFVVYYDDGFDHYVFDPICGAIINNYYGYCNDMGIDTSFYTISEWKKISTLNEV